MMKSKTANNFKTDYFSSSYLQRLPADRGRFVSNKIFPENSHYISVGFSPRKRCQKYPDDAEDF